jgi:hypothetical protein
MLPPRIRIVQASHGQQHRAAPVRLPDLTQRPDDLIRRLIGRPHGHDHQMRPRIKISQIGGRVVVRFADPPGVKELDNRRLLVGKAEYPGLARLRPKSLPDHRILGRETADDRRLSRTRFAKEPEIGNRLGEELRPPAANASSSRQLKKAKDCAWSIQQPITNGLARQAGVARTQRSFAAGLSADACGSAKASSQINFGWLGGTLRN